MSTRLDEQASKIVLHIVPFGAFDPATRFDVNVLYGQRELFEPFASPPREFSVLFQRGGALDNRYNFEGLLISRFSPDWKSPTSFTQIFRDGGIEVVDTSILARSGDRRLISGTDFEKRLLQALKRYLEAQQKLGVEPPLFVMISLLGVNGYIIDHYAQNEPSGFIDRADLVVPEVMIDNFDVTLAAVMKSVFDTIWNAAGWRRSMNYDEDGNSRLTGL